MSLEINDTTLGIWYIEFGNMAGNYTAILNKNEDNTYALTYRFRYYVDDKVGMESEDKKSFYSGTLEAPSDLEALDGVRQACKAVAAMSDGKFHEFLRGNRPVSELMDDFVAAPFTNIERVPSKEEMN